MPFDPTLTVLAVAVAVFATLLLVAVVPPWLGRRSPLLPGSVRRKRGGQSFDDWSTRRSHGPATSARLAELRALEARQARIDAAREAYGRDPREVYGDPPDPRDARDPREAAYRETGEILEARQRDPRALAHAPDPEPAPDPGLAADRPDDRRDTRLGEARERARDVEIGRQSSRGPVPDSLQGEASRLRPLRGEDAGRGGRRVDAEIGRDTGRHSLATAPVRVDDSGDLVPLDKARNPAAYDRIVRVVSMVFILAALAVVTVSGVWLDVQGGITLALIVAALGVLIVHDILPPGPARSTVLVLETLLAVGIAAFLVNVTGRQASPFFLVFALIVAGTALVASARTAITLAVFAAGAYAAAVVAAAPGVLDAAALSSVSLNITGLLLLTYVSTAIARMQRKSRDAAIRLSTIDAMTGLYNRPYLFSAIEGEIARSTRTGRGFCLLMMDLDELKTINDRYGHFVGDRALRSVADVIKFGVRRIDVPARYGGDEFVVLLPETDPTGGYVLGEKIRQGVSELLVPGTEIRTSMSVGMVAYPDDGRTADELMISADRAMYASKRLGKNRVMGASFAAAGRPDAPV